MKIYKDATLLTSLPLLPQPLLDHDIMMCTMNAKVADAARLEPNMDVHDNTQYTNIRIVNSTKQDISVEAVLNSWGKLLLPGESTSTWSIA